MATCCKLARIALRIVIILISNLGVALLSAGPNPESSSCCGTDRTHSIRSGKLEFTGRSYSCNENQGDTASTKIHGRTYLLRSFWGTWSGRALPSSGSNENGNSHKVWPACRVTSLASDSGSLEKCGVATFQAPQTPVARLISTGVSAAAGETGHCCQSSSLSASWYRITPENSKDRQKPCAAQKSRNLAMSCYERSDPDELCLNRDPTI